MRYQLLLPTELHFDLMNYCKENKLNPQDVIRKLIHFELYYEQSMSLKSRKEAKKAWKKNQKLRPSDKLGDL